MTIHHQHISSKHKANVTRALQGALQTLFARNPEERAKNFSENVADPATTLSGEVASTFKRSGLSLRLLLSRRHPEQASRWRCAISGGMKLPETPACFNALTSGKGI